MNEVTQNFKQFNYYLQFNWHLGLSLKENQYLRQFYELLVSKNCDLVYFLLQNGYLLQVYLVVILE